MDRANRMVRAVTACDKPVLAARQRDRGRRRLLGRAGRDLVVACESASFLLAFARIGLMPDGGTTATVAASIGRARAMRMALLAEPLPAAEALTPAWSATWSPDDGFADEVDRLSRRLAAGPPLAFAATKKAINAATLGALDAALERERTGQASCFAPPTWPRACAAFSERRRPVFRGE